VADLPASVQTRLARIVRDGEVLVEGVAQPHKIGVRVIAGCAPTVEAEVEQGGLRADLYRRLSAIRIEVPPLRLRPEDIPAIARHVMERVAREGGAGARGSRKRPSRCSRRCPGGATWRNSPACSARAGERAGGARARRGPAGRGGAEWRGTRWAGASLREAKRQFEREYIASVLRQHGWRMGEAARALGIQRTNLYRKARQLDIPRVR